MAIAVIAIVFIVVVVVAVIVFIITFNVVLVFCVLSDIKAISRFAFRVNLSVVDVDFTAR